MTETAEMTKELAVTKLATNRSPLPPIMRVPREIRGLIFNRLSQLEKLTLRYVCNDFRSEVDDFCEFSVTLDDRKDYLERISQLRVKKCKVLHFLEPWNNSVSDENVFFKSPGLLRSLKIDMITPENFHLLIRDTCSHLDELCAVLPFPLLSFEYPSQFNLNFENLSRLKLSISAVPEEPIMGPPRFQDQLLYRIFQGICCQKKKKLKMLAIAMRCLGFQQISNFTSKTLAFIAENYESLEHVDFDMMQGHGMMSFNEIRPLSEDHVNSINFKLLKKVTNLRSIRIVNSTSFGIDLWVQVLAQQRTLQFLETDILPVPNQLYQQIILNNENTLVHIDIGDLTIDSDWDDPDRRYFDATVFQNCRHLRKLTLDRNTLRRRPIGANNRAELINLHCLPEYLQELAINYFTLLSDELLILFNSGISQNLKSLTLTQCGEFGEFGVDGTVLEKIISMKAISFIEISPLNYTYPEERIKLNAILTTFNYAEGHSYFQLSKVANNFQIDFDDFTP